MQPQGQVQLVVRSFVHAQDPQATCDAPRWYAAEGSEIALEPAFGRGVAEDPERPGHRRMKGAPTSISGGAQVVRRMGRGYWAGSDPRKDRQAVGS
jgi:gamma-glutamyltranspeptidase/glutathione hydrolase